MNNQNHRAFRPPVDAPSEQTRSQRSTQSTLSGILPGPPGRRDHRIGRGTRRPVHREEQ